MKNVLSYLSCSRDDRVVIFRKCCKFYFGKSKPYLPHPIDKEQKRFLRAVWERRFPSGLIKCHIDKSQFSRDPRNLRCTISNDKCRAHIHFFYAIFLGEDGVTDIFNRIFDDRNATFSYPPSDRIKVCFYDLTKKTVSLVDKETGNVVTVLYHSKHDVTTYEALYNKGVDKQHKLKTSAVDNRLRKRVAVLNTKLKNIGVSQVTAKDDIYDCQSGYFKLWYKDSIHFFASRYFFAEIPLNGISQEYAAKKKLELERKLIAWLRYGSLEPVYLTDKEYCDFVRERTDGKFRPYKNRYPSTQHGDNTRKLVCTRCGATFVITPNFLLRDDIHCPVCERKQSRRYSKQAIAWLDDLSKRFKLRIRHAENGGEFGIKLGKVTHHVDGYCAKYNIVFEYHGSRWHGNPTVYYLDEHINPYSKAQTSLDLLKRTLWIEHKLIKAGYNYVRIWDADFLDSNRYKQWLTLNTKRIEAAQKQS